MRSPRAFPEATGKLAVLVHGLCMSDLQWMRQNHDHGAALARDLGFTPVYLSYNSGLHVSTNGRAFAEALEALVAAWPVEIEDFAIIGHSMGGLVARSACLHAEAAGHAWRGELRKLVFLGTPHHGAPLERVGNWVDVMVGKTPYAAAFGRLGKMRSAGVTDLRYGNLLDEDWQGRDRFAREPDPRRPAPLPKGVACYAVAATTAASPGDLKDRLLGDGLVPLASALGRHKESATRIEFPARAPVGRLRDRAPRPHEPARCIRAAGGVAGAALTVVVRRLRCGLAAELTASPPSRPSSLQTASIWRPRRRSTWRRRRRRGRGP